MQNVVLVDYSTTFRIGMHIRDSPVKRNCILANFMLHHRHLYKQTLEVPFTAYFQLDPFAAARPGRGVSIFLSAPYAAPKNSTVGSGLWRWIANVTNGAPLDAFLPAQCNISMPECSSKLRVHALPGLSLATDPYVHARFLSLTAKAIVAPVTDVSYAGALNSLLAATSLARAANITVFTQWDGAVACVTEECTALLQAQLAGSAESTHLPAHPSFPLLANGRGDTASIVFSTRIPDAGLLEIATAQSSVRREKEIARLLASFSPTIDPPDENLIDRVDENENDLTETDA
jgi:hypothetical protein